MSRKKHKGSKIVRNKKIEEVSWKEISIFKIAYRISSIVFLVLLFAVLMLMVSRLPRMGDAYNPQNNEVSRRYIEQGLQETGAVNVVTGMILDYRAFDTFGESCVLFTAACSVFILLRIPDKNELERKAEDEDDRKFEPRNDIILRKVTVIVVPLILVFGIYIILNGHLSPGGGFAGGAVLGAGLILYLNSYGFHSASRVMNEKKVKLLTFISLLVYCVAKSYSFYTGANHIDSGIPLGIPGNILSGGLILLLNICVGIVVACTLYSFYTLVRRGKV